MKAETESYAKLSPKAFLKSRRPERFSDSIAKEIGRLDRSVLEFQLSTLNRRSMELAFEDFAKKLCEKTICPNLLEQTGPVAGGDGKVDTQTFPVSEQSKILWYVGVNENSNSERWAFAVSTQEDWKSKCRKDVRKIKATERDYKKAFCITNMYTKANQRSELEDSLKKETGIDVRILDVSWILDQIFTNGYEQLAIDTLSIEVDWRREIETGANDYSRNIRLRELEQDINNEINVSQILPDQLDWLLEVAVLTKELEKPLIETQGLFSRAIKSAERFGFSYNQFNAYYEYASAAYWWFEDIDLFGKQILQCLRLAKEIDQSEQWGRAVSLLGLYCSYCRNTKKKNTLDIDSLLLEARNGLNKLAGKDDQPSNSLMARAYIELLNLQLLEDIDQAPEIFSSLLMTVRESENLVGFSFIELYGWVSELDSVFGELENYENLLDYLTSYASQREGETKGSLLWLKRGARRLESNEPYQAIKLVGKSLTGLYKKESKKELYLALNILSAAYMKVGLLWASRANLLLAGSLVTDDFWKSGDFFAAQTHSYIRLAKLELQLGRINYALKWWELACIFSTQTEEALSQDEYLAFDAFLSQCILNTTIEKLDSIRRLPDLLDRYELFHSRSMLLYSLGHESLVEAEWELKIGQEYIDYPKLVRDADLGSPIPEIINCEERYSHLKSSVMGCEIRISFPFRSPLVELAETLLSSIEAFLSTNIVDRVMVFESQLDIEITADDDDEISISHELDDTNGILKMEVLCSSFTPDMLSISGQRLIQEWLQKFVVEVFARLMYLESPEEILESMLGGDRALERSVSFGSCFVGLQNVMGKNAVKDIKSLLLEGNLKDYEPLRTSAWDNDFPKILQPEKPSTEKRENLEGLPYPENITHRSMIVQKLIKIRLWDKTTWQGVGFTMQRDGTPGLALLFESEKAGRDIFDDLRRELGREDRANRLRVSIIRHIDKKSPTHYKLCLSENMPFVKEGRIQLVSKYQTMTPTTKDGIEGFLESYKKAERYILSYGVMKDEKIIETHSHVKNELTKFHINVLEASEIGPNDVEIMAIQKNDDPITPD